MEGSLFDELSMSIKNWRVSLASRNNLHYNNIPYIPMLVEDIPAYISLEDHAKNGVKKIQTYGEFIPKTEAFAMLASLTPGNATKFPLIFRNLSVKDVYIKVSHDTYCTIWQKCIVFRVYGALKVEEELGNVLETSHLVPIHDIKGTITVMTLLIETARSEYRQYFRTKAQNDMLKLQWDKMKEENKRLIRENE